MRDVVSEARAAAAAGNEQEGEEGPAGKAAARAASLGLQATSTGYATLGGIEHHVSVNIFVSTADLLSSAHEILLRFCFQLHVHASSAMADLSLSAVKEVHVFHCNLQSSHAVCTVT